MATTIRQQIFDNVKTRMQTITIVNGYETNIGNGVFDWREYAIGSDESEALVIRDPGQEVDEERTDHHCHSFILTIELSITVSGSNTSTQLRKILGDIHKAIGVDEQWSGKAHMTLPGTDSMKQEHEENKFGDIVFTIDIFYATKAWDPYTLYNI